MKITGLQREEDANGMSAMSDVVFLLLIFFIVTMTGYAEMTLIETNLPQADAPGTLESDLSRTVNVYMAADGTRAVNGTPQTPEAFRRLLSRYARLMPDAVFLLKIDPEVRHHDLVALLHEFAKHGLQNTSLLKN